MNDRPVQQTRFYTYANGFAVYLEEMREVPLAHCFYRDYATVFLRPQGAMESTKMEHSKVTVQIKSSCIRLTKLHMCNMTFLQEE